MALIDLYKKDIFKRVGKTADSFANDYADGFTANKTIGSPTDYKLNKLTPTQISSDPIPTSTIRKMAEEYYDSAPLLRANYLGQTTEPLVFIKPNESKDQYSTKADYTNTRRAATAKWLTSPKGFRFEANQIALQLLNPTLESKIYNPLSIFSKTIPLVDYHERRHMTISSLFGIPLDVFGISAPASYTEAIWNNEHHSRNVNQSPFMAARIASENLPGIDFAFSGRDYMMNDSTWNRINPNRYLYPIGSDGAGLPISNRLTPGEEKQRNKGLAAQAFRFTKASGFNPILDAQITINDQKSGSSFLQKLLKNIPYANTILRLFGYGILDKAEKIKIFNRYNPTFPYSEYGGNEIRIINADGELLDVYAVDLSESPIDAVLQTIEKVIKVGSGTESPPKGFTFASRQKLERAAGYQDGFQDQRILYNPQDDMPTVNQYMQAYGDVMKKRSGDKSGTANIDSLVPSLDDRKPYTKYMESLTKDEGSQPTKKGLRILHSPTGYGMARPGAKNLEDRIGDQISLLPYGEDYEVDPKDSTSTAKDFTDLVPFKFYHINERKWIVFRATLTGINDQITPSWSGKKYIGRADQVYTYSGAERTINFAFTIVVNSPKEMKPLYEKLNYLIGLNYPKYRNLSSKMGIYMEAPFVRLTIGDLFKNVSGILQGGIIVTVGDDATWEVRNEHPHLSDYDVEASKIGKIQVAKLPRLIEVSINGFTPFGLENRPISSTSPFYSAIKEWQNQSENPNSNPTTETGAV